MNKNEPLTGMQYQLLINLITGVSTVDEVEWYQLGRLVQQLQGLRDAVK